GPIVDRARRLLVGTTGRLSVTADSASLGAIDSHGFWRPTAVGRAQLGRLARLTHERTITLIREVRRSVRRSPFAPAVVIPRASRQLAAYVDERAELFRGIQTAVLPERWYPFGGFGSEFLGLLGEVNKQELHSRRYAHARAGQVVGQSGVEATYDRALDAGLARARVPVDARGTVVGPLHVLPARRRGRGLQLTIDARLQHTAERAIQDGIAYAHRAGHGDADAGAAVVMNPWNGAIYALASYPSFDQHAAAHDPRYFASLFRAHNTPLIDRATQGL